MWGCEGRRLGTFWRRWWWVSAGSAWREGFQEEDGITKWPWGSPHLPSVIIDGQLEAKRDSNAGLFLPAIKTDLSAYLIIWPPSRLWKWKAKMIILLSLFCPGSNVKPCLCWLSRESYWEWWEGFCEPTLSNDERILWKVFCSFWQAALVRCPILFGFLASSCPHICDILSEKLIW